MRKQHTEILPYLTPELITVLNELIRRSPGLDLIKMLNNIGSNSGIRSKTYQLLKFYSIEVGDKDFVTFDEPIKYGDSVRSLVYSKYFPIHFTVTNIDYVNLRMDGFIDNLYFVKGIYFSDFNYYTHLKQYTPEELKIMINDRNEIMVGKYNFSVVNNNNEFPVMDNREDQFSYNW